MKILLTGSGGFAGNFFKNFLKYKQINLFTMGINNSPNENHLKISPNLDFREIKKVILDISPDYIFHLAGSPIKGKENSVNDLNFKYCLLYTSPSPRDV